MKTSPVFPSLVGKFFVEIQIDSEPKGWGQFSM